MSSEEVIKPMPPPLTGFKAHRLMRREEDGAVRRRSQREKGGDRTEEPFRFSMVTARC